MTVLKSLGPVIRSQVVSFLVSPESVLIAIAFLARKLGWNERRANVFGPSWKQENAVMQGFQTTKGRRIPNKKFEVIVFIVVADSR